MSVKTIYKPLKFLYWYIMYTFITFIVKEMQENKIMYISEVKSGNTCILKTKCICTNNWVDKNLELWVGSLKLPISYPSIACDTWFSKSNQSYYL